MKKITASVVSLSRLLGMLRALQWMYQTAHWQTQGDQFYGDHLLFERLYAGLGEEIDGLAEKLVAMAGPETVNPGPQGAHLASFIQEWQGWGGSPFFIGLKAEQNLQEAIKGLLSDPSLSTGMENFLQGLADTHETNIYLLLQRASPSRVARATLRMRALVMHPSADLQGLAPFRSPARAQQDGRIGCAHAHVRHR